MRSILGFANQSRPIFTHNDIEPCSFLIGTCHAYTSSSPAPHRQYRRQRSSCNSKAVISVVGKASMANAVALEEDRIRQVVTASLKSALGVPRHSWSQEFVVETILSMLTTSIPVPDDSGSSSNSSDGEPHPEAAVQRTTAATAAEAGAPATSPDMPVSSTMGGSSTTRGSSTKGGGKLQKQRQKSSCRQTKAAKPVESAAIAATSTRHVGSGSITSKQADSVGDVLLAQDIVELLDGCMEAAAGDGRSSDDDAGNISSPAADMLQSSFTQLLYDNYHQVEAEDACSFCSKLLQDLAALVRTALEAQSEDSQGLCGLCLRDMPLTKHHLIPRDIHKEFKKRGYSFAQLQCAVLVCRPCHNAIHRAVPDNKQLALHYSTLEALSQHEEIAKFAAWARKQRVSSKADTTLKHHRYRR